MKVQIETGNCPNYFSTGKIYETIFKDIESDCYYVRDDNNSVRLICLNDCYHLNRGSWRIV